MQANADEAYRPFYLGALRQNNFLLIGMDLRKHG
jgi:hypothetical protein